MTLQTTAQTIELDEVTDIVVTAIVPAPPGEIGYQREIRIFVTPPEEGEASVQALTIRLKSVDQAAITISAPAAEF